MSQGGNSNSIVVGNSSTNRDISQNNASTNRREGNKYGAGCITGRDAHVAESARFAGQAFTYGASSGSGSGRGSGRGQAANAATQDQTMVNTNSINAGDNNWDRYGPGCITGSNARVADRAMFEGPAFMGSVMSGDLRKTGGNSINMGRGNVIKKSINQECDGGPGRNVICDNTIGDNVNQIMINTSDQSENNLRVQGNVEVGGKVVQKLDNVGGSSDEIVPTLIVPDELVPLSMSNEEEIHAPTSVNKEFASISEINSGNKIVYKRPVAEKVTVVKPNTAATTTGHRDFIQGNVDSIQIAQGEYSTKSAIGNSQTREIGSSIRSYLKNLSKKLMLPSEPWLEKLDFSFKHYTKLQLVSNNEYGIKQTIELEDMFDDISYTDSYHISSPRRILVESPPGFAKTTLAHKIVLDWANEAEYVSRFNTAILMRLRYFKAASSTLKDELIKVIHTDHTDVDEIWEIINNDTTLLVLDGLDEIDRDARSNVDEVLWCRKNGYKMTIVATRNTKPTVMRHGVEKVLRKLHRLTDHENWYRKIMILGISSGKRVEFCANFVDDYEKDKIMPRICALIDSREELLKSPLLLILLVFVLQTDQIFKTNTHLYKAFVDCIVRYSMSKTSTSLPDTNFTLFDSSLKEDPFVQYKDIFFKFGQTSLDCFLTKNFCISDVSDCDSVSNLGLLDKYTDSNIRYGIIDVSVMEFAASAFIAKKFQMNENVFTCEDIEYINKVCKQKRSSSLMIPFLCGFLENDVWRLFDQLSPHRVLYCFNQELIQSMLAECKMNKFIAKYFQPLLPPYIKVLHSNSPFVLENQDLNNNLSTVFCTLEKLQEVKKPMHCNYMCVEGFGDCKALMTEEIVQMAENVKCKKFALITGYSWCYESIAQGLKLLSSIASDRKILCISFDEPESYFDLEKSVTNNILQGVKIDRLLLCLDESAPPDLIAKLVEKNEIKDLVIRDCSWHSQRISEADVARLATKTDRLESLEIFNACQQNGDLDLYCQSIQANNISVSSKTRLVIDGNSKPLNLDIGTKMSESYCDCLIFKSLHNNPNASEWNGLGSVFELTIAIHDLNVGLDNLDFQNFAAKLLNLKVLILDLVDDSNDGIINNVISSFSSIKLTRIEVKRLNQICCCDKIVLAVVNLVQQQKITNFDEIRFVNLHDELVQESASQKERIITFENVISALRCDSRVTFYFYFGGWNFLQSFVKTYQSSFLHFKVEYSFIADCIQTIHTKYIDNDRQSHVECDTWCNWHSLHLALPNDTKSIDN